MLQEMRSHGKIIWFVLFFAFVGGYLLLDTSGLLGRQLVTTGTSIGSVNGQDITYGVWQNRVQELVTQREQQGRAIDLDERAQLENQAFEDLVMDVVLRDEFARRHIVITDEEIREAARYQPPPALMQNPELQTEGRFDPQKWERFLASPAVRQQGILLQLEQYYRETMPRDKLFSQLAGDVYPSDAYLWRMYQDTHDTVVASYVAFKPAAGADTAAKAQVTDADVNAYYATYKDRLNAPTRGSVTALVISRKPTAADSVATRARMADIRARIVKGEKFEAVAKEVSEDTISGKDGGNLGMLGKGRLIKEFEEPAFKLKPGELSDIVRTPYGLHLIRVDSKKGDSISVRHILLNFRQSDSNATATDRLADSLQKMIAGSDNGAKLDSAATRFHLSKSEIDVVEGQSAIGPEGTALPGLSQWATNSGAKVGEISDLFDSDSAYFIARLDSLVEGGEAPLAKVKEDIRLYLARKKAVEARRQDATDFAKAAAAVSLEEAAKAKSYKVETTGPVTRVSFVPGLGGGHPAIGAAFGLATGATSAPVIADDGVYVVRSDRRHNADREEWTKQKDTQRAQLEQQLQQDRFRQYLAALREEAKVDDKRKQVLAAGRRQAQ